MFESFQALFFFSLQTVTTMTYLDMLRLYHLHTWKIISHTWCKMVQFHFGLVLSESCWTWLVVMNQFRDLHGLRRLHRLISSYGILTWRILFGRCQRQKLRTVAAIETGTPRMPENTRRESECRLDILHARHEKQTGWVCLAFCSIASTSMKTLLFWAALSYSESSFILLSLVWKWYVTETPSVIMNDLVQLSGRRWWEWLWVCLYYVSFHEDSLLETPHGSVNRCPLSSIRLWSTL